MVAVARLWRWRRRGCARVLYPDAAAVPIDDGSSMTYAEHGREQAWAIAPTLRLPIVAARPLLTRAGEHRAACGRAS